MRRFWIVLASIFFLVSQTLLSKSILCFNFDALDTIVTDYVWYFAVINAFFVMILARKGPFQTAMLDRKYGFVFKSMMELLVYEMIAQFIHLVVEEDVLDMYLMGSIACIRIYSLAVTRLAVEELDLSSLVISVKLLLHLAVHEGQALFMALCLLTLTVLLVQGYFEAEENRKTRREIIEDEGRLLPFHHGTSAKKNGNGKKKGARYH
ncbi:hypothetical protein CCACVL1_25168 [Corchorus capsularis]|uniref:Uncharacterized protein n=1 Tax=Corchorus capsularis TaxID=210143 RepID=A0A1R3GLN1_COCAP|nr:hypothetical protein CCACVL1_25168 [Corchorus capsularis]